jgi:hypothetical protein
MINSVNQHIKKIKNLFIFITIFCVSTIFAESSNLINSSEIDSIILEKVSHAILYFEHIQKPSGAICDSKNSIFEVWETINAAFSIALWSQIIEYDADSVMGKALAFLKSVENPDGMVLHNSKHQNSYCLETSSEYVCLLTMIYPKSESTLIEKIEFIKSQQLSTGVWNIVSPIIPKNLQQFPSVTAFALKALQCYDEKQRDFNKAIEFLIHAQDSSGHWGTAWQYYGTPFYAMVPILSVLRFHRSKYKDVIDNAARYLIGTQNDDGGWCYKLTGFDNLPSAELQSALALQSYLYCSLDPSDEVIERALVWLLDRQIDDGHWHGGYFPNQQIQKSEDIYATAQILIALDQYWILKENKR